MQYTNKHNLPDWLVTALKHSDYPEMDGIISVTTLIDSPRIAYLYKLHADDIYEDVADRVYLFMGTAIHEQISRAIDSKISELRMAAAVGDVVVSGQIDILDGDTIYDIKTTSGYNAKSGELKQSWINQTNVYRWLAERNGYKINHLKIAMIVRDWSSQDNYPPFIIKDVPVMNDVDSYIAERVRLHTQNPAEYVCTPDDMWGPSTKYAIHYGQQRRAKMVVDKDGLDAWMSGRSDVATYNAPVLDETGYYIVERHEVPIRCQKYCPVSRWCEVYHGFSRLAR